MDQYSTSDEVKDFIARLGPNPLFVCDMDGNVMTGYSLAKGRTIETKPGDNPKTQSIPFGSPPSLIDAWVSQGVLKKGLFAEKTMDARLPPLLVDLVNMAVQNNENFKLAFLTSRGADDALVLLRESGVAHPEKTTLVADSGATLYLKGEKHEIRKLSNSETEWMAETVDRRLSAFHDTARGIADDLGFDSRGCPAPMIEAKGIATNIHYREILTHYDQPEGSPLDTRIGEAFKQYLAPQVKVGPQEPAGPVFKLLDGPATVEIKVASVDKGQGLFAIAYNAMRSGNAPSAIVFSGDDASKGNGLPGTDYFAMARADELEHHFGTPFFNVLTHHPENGNLDSETPDPDRAVSRLEAPYTIPRIDLRVKSPRENAAIVLKANGINPAQWPDTTPRYNYAQPFADLSN